MINYTGIFDPEETGGIFACYTVDREGHWADDSRETVDNYIELGELLGAAPERIVRTRQRHTDLVLETGMENGGEGIFSGESRRICDGMITNTPGILLTVITADCVPVLLADPVRKVVGAVHSGWRGTALGISGNAVRLMQESFGTEPKDVIAYIGPHICGRCYEVGEDVRDAFAKEFSKKQRDSYFVPKAEGKYLLDLETAVRDTLQSAGVCGENIRSSGICTFENREMFSWRRDHLQNHSILTVTGITEGLRTGQKQ